MSKRTNANSQAGFSLLELLVVVALLSLMMGAIFSQINQAQQNSSSQQAKLDLFQESREFMDQIARDLRASGYPNTRNFSSDPVSPAEESPQEAVGLVSMDVGKLWFESSIDGSGNVSVIHYNLVTTGTGCSAASPCLERSQTAKIQADPLTGQTESDQVDVQSVLNGTTADPIFKAYYADGTAVTMPIDITNNALANVNTIDIILKVQSSTPDPLAGKYVHGVLTPLYPTTTLMTTVRLNNCSVAYPSTTGTVMGCK